MSRIICLSVLVLIVIQHASSFDIGDVHYYLYNADNIETPQSLGSVVFGKRSLPRIDASRTVKILCHGYVDNATSYWIAPTKDAYMKMHKINIISVDWSKHAHGLYGKATDMAPNVGEHIASLILDIHTKMDIPLKNFHLIGHSLGSHISGYAGKKVFAETGEKIGRITGLDPAGPSFNGKDIAHRLSTADALFVDAIHTDTSILGYKKSIGHADFWPNGGSAQNGCSLISGCSHCRAPMYFYESIGSTDFPAWECDSIKSFNNGKCKNNVKAIMGDNCDTSTRGDFYLRTNKESPYGIRSY